jgi:glucoamylase
VTALDDWVEKEARLAADAMLRAVSATQIIKERPGFGQRIVPRQGSVVASPVLAAYDPDPDYFFHWFRDSAIIIDALRVALAQGFTHATSIERLREFVDFSRALRKLDGREFLRQGHFRKTVQPSFLQYVRPDDEIAAIFGGAVLAEARINPDGTLDSTRWARPQNDGPALQVLALTRWRDAEPNLDERLQAAMLELVISNLDFILSRATDRSFDIWEEESGYHYYTQLVQAQALACGAKWLAEMGDGARARNCRSVAGELDASLGAYWSAADGHYRSRMGVIGGGAPSKALDIAVILGVLHAGRGAGTHSVLDPRAQATLAALEDLFDAEYPINAKRSRDQGPAMGRYAKDAYYGGNPWYLATLAAAEFYFKLAIVLRSGGEIATTDDNARFRERLTGESPTKAAFERGERFMRTVRAYTPPAGDLSEQFDHTTGAQTSAKRLAWSYAALITAAASRRQAGQAIRD